MGALLSSMPGPTVCRDGFARRSLARRRSAWRKCEQCGSESPLVRHEIKCCPTLKMANSKEYLERNREAINQQRRERYNSEARKRRYYEKRDTILQRCREDKAMCPLCRIEYHRRYLRTHLVGRHRLEESEVERLL